jgi:flagellar biogenesis protein FliO
MLKAILILGFCIALVALAVWVVHQLRKKANPSAPLTRWQDGRRG